MMSSGQCLIRVPIAIALVSLLACTPVATKAPVPSAVPPPSAGVTPPAPSAASAAAQQHYARVQANLLARGLMRTDGGTLDAPFTDRMLADNDRMRRAADMRQGMDGDEQDEADDTPRATVRKVREQPIGKKELAQAVAASAIAGDPDLQPGLPLGRPN